MIKKLRSVLDEKKGQKKKLEEEIKELRTKINRLSLKQMNIEIAATIIQTVAKGTQDQLKYRISEPVTLALESIFPEDPHSLYVEFPYRRNQTECDLFFEQEGELDDPLRGGSGGVIDVASFALKSSLISLHHPKPRSVLILDEPFKMLDKDKHNLAGEMIKKVAEKLELQILMTTHSPELAEYGDKIFRVTKKNKRSYIQ